MAVLDKPPLRALRGVWPTIVGSLILALVILDAVREHARNIGREPTSGLAAYFAVLALTLAISSVSFMLLESLASALSARLQEEEFIPAENAVLKAAAWVTGAFVLLATGVWIRAGLISWHLIAAGVAGCLAGAAALLGRPADRGKRAAGVGIMYLAIIMAIINYVALRFS